MFHSSTNPWKMHTLQLPRVSEPPAVLGYACLRLKQASVVLWWKLRHSSLLDPTTPLTQKLGPPLGRHQTKRHNLAKIRRRIYHLQQVRKTLGIFPKAVSSPNMNSEIGRSFKLRVHAYSQRGLSRGKFSIELGQRCMASEIQLIEVRRVRKDQHHHPLDSSWAGGWGKI